MIDLRNAMNNNAVSIYEDLKQKIEKNEIQSNTFLPSENELMNIYQSSRDTIRKSLSLLQLTFRN